MRHTETSGLGNSQCQDCGFRGLVLFADLRADDLALIDLPIGEIAFDAGGTLYHAEDDAASLFTLRSGLVKLVRSLPDGTQRIVRLLKRGAIAGLEATLGKPYEHTAIALQPTIVCRIPRQVVLRLLETPRLHTQLLLRWHDSLRDADDFLTDLSTGKAPQRLARLLLRLVEPDHATVPLFTREDLGAMLGITTEHASRTVAELKRAGAISGLAGNRCRFDIAKLAALATPEG